jgi:signal peptidase I
MFLLYNGITHFLVSTWVLHNETMLPGLRTGDRFIVVSSIVPSLFADIRQDEAPSYKRGSLVLIDTSRNENRNWFLIAADGFIRFFTAQRISIFGRDEHIYIKRLIGFPGDEISMINYVMRIRPSGSQFTLTEFELSDRPYYPNIPQTPVEWDSSLPLSGNMDRRVLGPSEYFIISDDRGTTGDSRTWGPVNSKQITGRPVFRYWPLTRLGRP